MLEVVKRTMFSGALHLMAAFSIFLGLGLVGFGAPIYASVSPAGTAMVDMMIPNEMELRPSAAATNPYVAAEAAIQLTLGILLIVLGFFIHGVARMRDERLVHISVKPKKKRTWYWMEVSLR